MLEKGKTRSKTFTFFGVFSKFGFLRARKSKPYTTGTEFAVEITIEIPESWFEPKPTLKFHVKVDQEKPEIKLPNPNAIKSVLFNNGFNVDLIESKTEDASKEEK